MPRKNSKAARPKKAKISVHILRKRRILTQFKNYVDQYIESYDRADRLDWLHEESIIDDFLYGVGLAIDEETYRGADGYDRFKKMLSERFLVEMLNGKIR